MQFLLFVHFLAQQKVYVIDIQITNNIKLITFLLFSKKCVQKYTCFHYLAVSILL
jgi:hypothetical protein